jgi:sialic acid synthase SpsE
MILMQCNTNYTGEDENYKHINLNVLNTYKALFPDIILGLSDHTHGAVTVLGSIALGAKVIEKHFTDDTKRKGPDHPFSMDPESWRKMVNETRLLESALGSFVKKVEDNEKETVILQRRAIRVIQDIKEGEEITLDKIQFQRPCPKEAFDVNKIDQILGKKANKDIENGDFIGLNSIKW